MALILLSTLAVGAGYLGMAGTRELWVACAFSVVGGAGNGIQWVAVLTALQEATPADLQARVTSLLESIGSAATGVGFLLGAIEHGVAHVMLPLFAGDQWRTARRVEELGAGIAVRAGERRVFDPPSDEVIAALPAAVGRVLDDARRREAAAGLGAQMAALPTADAAAAALVARFA